MPSYKELLAQRENLERQIEEAKSREYAEVLNEIKQKMADYGITLADLGIGRGKLPKGGARPRAGVAPKYRDPVSGNTWSGRGNPPKEFQFKKGVSGNLKGRPPKGRKDQLAIDIISEFRNILTAYREGGRAKRWGLDAPPWVAPEPDYWSPRSTATTATSRCFRRRSAMSCLMPIRTHFWMAAKFRNGGPGQSTCGGR